MSDELFIVINECFPYNSVKEVICFSLAGITVSIRSKCSSASKKICYWTAQDLASYPDNFIHTLI